VRQEFFDKTAEQNQITRAKTILRRVGLTSMMITAREREVFEVGAQGRDERRDRRHLLDRAAGGTRHWSASAAPDELELAIVVVLRTQQATTPRQSRNQ